MIGGRRILPTAKATPPFFRYNYFERMTYFSAYHISPGTVLNYVDGMNKHKIDFIMGYAVSNYALAKFINQNNIRAPKLKAVITSSEKLTEEMRVALKRAYGCETYDTWSGVEACAQISECEYHSLHESPDIGIIELVDEYGKYVENGQTGEAICTSLINFDQPLIRYRCGDLLTSGESSCTCGRNMKVYSNIVGRLEDIVIGKDGREMVRFHGLFLELDTVVQGQVIQYAEDDFEIKVVCSGKLTENESEKIKMRLFSQVGNVRLRVTQVEELEKGPNGKFKAVISKIKR